MRSAAELRERLRERGVDLVLTAAAKQALVAEGYDPTYGARPLRRVLHWRIENADSSACSPASSTRATPCWWTTHPTATPSCQVPVPQAPAHTPLPPSGRPSADLLKNVHEAGKCSAQVGRCQDFAGGRVRCPADVPFPRRPKSISGLARG